MNRKQLRACKAYERKYIAKRAEKCTAFCFNINGNKWHAQITNPTECTLNVDQHGAHH